MHSCPVRPLSIASSDSRALAIQLWKRDDSCLLTYIEEDLYVQIHNISLLYAVEDRRLERHRNSEEGEIQILIEGSGKTLGERIT